MLKFIVIFILVNLCKTRGVNDETFAFEKLDFDYFDMMSFQNVTKIKETLNQASIFRKNVTEECQRDLIVFFNGVMNAESWALSMLDSIEKFPSGILAGRRVIIGQFSECLEVEHINFKGKHCLVEVAKKNELVKLHWPDNAIERLRNSQFGYGICVPSSCNSSDIKYTFRALGLDSFISLEVNETSCTLGEFQSLRAEDWLTITFIIVLVLLSGASTAYEMYYITIKKSEPPSVILTSFSLYNNGKRLFSISDSNSEMNSLYGIRFISITWVILGHFFSSLYRGAVTNTFDAILLANDKVAIPATNGYLSVDSFFFLSGLLVCFVFFRDISKKGSYDAPLGFLNRYLRLTPPFAVTLLFQATLFSRLGNGPIWKPDTEVLENICRKSWWADLLYIDNYFSRTKRCLGQSWYLCADMQMFLLSPILLYVLLLCPKIAPLTLFFTTMAGGLLSFIMSFENDLPPNLSVRINALRTEAESKEYRQFQTRMAPYIIGIATAYLLCGIRAKKIKFNLKKKWIFIGWAISGALCLGSLYGIAAFMPVGSYHSPLAKSLYRSFHRIGWTLGLAWIVVACVNGYGGPINKFLSWNVFQPLAKLSYGIFLVHKSVQIFRNSNTKSIKYFSTEDIVYSYIGDVVLSTILAIPLTLLVEMPFININKWILQNVELLPLPKNAKKIENDDAVKEKPIPT